MSRHRFDHAAALALYLALDATERTYAEVARRVGVSETTIRRVAKEDNWDAELAKAGRRLVEKAQRTRQERMAQLLRIYDHASDVVEAGLTPDADGQRVFDAELVLARFPEIHRIYRLETEQATDHVALAEVQAGFRTAMEVALATAERAAGQLMDEEQTRAFVGRFRELFLPAVNEALAVGQGGDT